MLKKTSVIIGILLCNFRTNVCRKRLQLQSIEYIFFQTKDSTVVEVTFDKNVGARLNKFILILKLSQGAFAQSIGVFGPRGRQNDPDRRGAEQ